MIDKHINLASLSLRQILLLAGIVASVSLLPTSLLAQSAPPLENFPEVSFAKQAAAPAARIAQQQNLPALTSLDTAEKSASDQLSAMRSWNDSGMRPTRNGFTRALQPAAISLAAANKRTGSTPESKVGLSRVAQERSAGVLRIGAWAEVLGADSLRLKLTEVDLPEESQLWVYGPGNEEVSFGLELRSDNGELWTPSIEGDRIYLEVQVPQAAIRSNHRFLIEDVMQLFTGASLYEKEGECLLDALCSEANALISIASARAATAQLQFVSGGAGFVCSGTLINDQASSGVPYLLTANHCFASQSVVNTLESRWDFKTSSCNGSAPSLSSRPRSNGGTLLATGASSDFTFLRLKSVPSGRAAMGWTTTNPSGGTRLHRVSHPLTNGSVNPQRYSRSNVNNNITAFSDVPRSLFIYDQWSKGSTFGGSSGSAIVNDSGQIVGQLTGGVAGCSAGGYDYNGKFSKTFPSVKQWLENGTTGGDTSPCSANSSTICLVSDQFEVKATYRTNAGTGNLLWEKHTNNTGLAFFTDSSNKEVILKVLDACGFNGKYWVFVGGVTDQEINVTVRNTSNGAVYSYKNNLGTAFVTDNDTSAFSCN